MSALEYSKFLLAASLCAFAAVMGVGQVVDVTLAGEPWGGAYGFPIVWSAAGPTSMSRQIAYLALLVDWAVYACALVGLGTVMLRRVVNQLWRRSLIRTLLGIGIVAFLAALFLGGGHFWDVELVPFLTDVSVVPGSARFHFGFSPK